MKLFQNLILLVVLFLHGGCREEYFPNIQPGEQSLLVVEGYLNSGNGPTTIKLSRTTQLVDSVLRRTEDGATVWVENKSGNRVPLYENFGTGTYTCGPFFPSGNDSFNLHITTDMGNEYVSEYIGVLKNPDIDSVSWRRTNNDVTVFVNTHNAENNTNYYRWEFDETWEYNSAFVSVYKFENGKVVPRTLPNEQVYTCWRNVPSSAIVTASTAGLQNDVVFEKPLVIIPQNSVKLGVRYSILVRQYAMDKRGYEFYQLLKKNTESLGSIFDAQPTEIFSNITVVKGAPKSVIGYVSMLPVWEKRIFISRGQLSDWEIERGCTSVDVPNNDVAIKEQFVSNNLMPWDAKGAGPSIISWYSAVPECVDCRLRGGTTEQPFFW